MKQKFYYLLIRRICIGFSMILPVLGITKVDAQGTEKIVLSLKITEDISEIYTINPDGTEPAFLFSFYNQIADSIGRAYNLRISPDGKYIAFDSKHDQWFNPQQYNIFHISSDGSWWDMDTPDDKAGWYQSGTGTVYGTITDFATPNGWVTIEGYPYITSTNAYGEYSISNVPAGTRFITAFSFNTGWYNYVPVTVVAGQSVQAATIGTTYDSYYRGMSTDPAWSSDGNYIYWSALDYSVKKTPRGGGVSENILATDMNRSQHIDISPVDGKIVYIKDNDGVYTANSDGSSPTKIFNDPGAYGYYNKVRWSHDGNRIAYATYSNGEKYAVIIDKNGNYQSSFYFAGYDLLIGGWSPNNDKLAVSLWKDPDSVYVYAVLADAPNTNTYVAGPAAIEEGVDWGILNPVQTKVKNKFTESDVKLELYPNPSVDRLINIKIYNTGKENVTLEIMNVNGSVVYNQSFNNPASFGYITKSIDLSAYHAGLYLVKLQYGNIIKVEKVVLQ